MIGKCKCAKVLKIRIKNNFRNTAMNIVMRKQDSKNMLASLLLENASVKKIMKLDVLKTVK